VGEGRISKIAYGSYDTLDIGADLGTPVSNEYKVPFRFGHPGQGAGGTPLTRRHRARPALAGWVFLVLMCLSLCAGLAWGGEGRAPWAVPPA
jgi:hypothetical protein